MPNTDAIYADLQEVKEKQAVYEKALYGSAGTPGVLTLLDRFGRCVERVEKRLDDWDKAAKEEEKERKSQRAGVMMLALSGMLTGVVGAAGWLATWIMAKVDGKVP